MQSLLILGRQPELGLAELASLYGPATVSRPANDVAVVDVDPCLLAFDRLGGSQKFAKILTVLETTDWQKIEDFLVTSAPEQAEKVPSGKLTIGLSTYGFNIDVSAIRATGLKLKRAILASDRSVRIVPNNNQVLNSAQVSHNRLTSEKGWELLFIRSEQKTYIAQTVKVQAIDSYRKRDQARPYRDAKVGMLPPKLAQIIINLASGELAESQLTNICEVDGNKPLNLDQTILDAFCGSGVVLQEALLMGYNVIGSDISPKMVDYSQKNLLWLASNRQLATTSKVLTADATSNRWDSFDFVATEVALGLPLSHVPVQSELLKLIATADKLLSGFLTNLAKQTKVGLRLCIAIPAWQTSKDHFTSLPMIDHLSNLGYNLLDFKHIGTEQLIYYRPDQIVGRQLLVMVRN